MHQKRLGDDRGNGCASTQTAEQLKEHWSRAPNGKGRKDGVWLGGRVEAHSFDFFRRVHSILLYLFYL